MAQLPILQRSVLLALLVSACSPRHVVDPAPVPPTHEPAPPPVPPVERGRASAAAASNAPEARAPDSAQLGFERVLEAPVHSLAFGRKSFVAALGDEAWLDRGHGFAKMPQPSRPTAHVNIYFGRDNQPRLMGFERPGQGEGAEASVYLRWLAGRWQSGASEIGKLAAPSGALYGVLGWDDPEVVCKRGEQCIIKRLSGWKFIEPLPGLPSVTLCAGQAWAFEGNQLWLLEGAAWRSIPVASSARQISAVWGSSAADLWFADATRAAIYHFSNDTWTEHPSPVTEPRALAVSPPQTTPGAAAIWVAGESGAARFDGQEWLLASDAPSEARLIATRDSGEIWIAGRTGLWRATGTPR